MHLQKLFRHIAVACVLLSSLEAEDSDAFLAYLKPYIERSDFIVDVCIYEREWKAPTEGMDEGIFIERAVVTGVHKGKISIGTKIEMQSIAVRPPDYFKNFKTVVEGELETVMFSEDIVQRFKDGKYYVIDHYKFDRCKGKVAEAFQEELKTNPVFKPKGEQDAVPTDGDKPPN